MFDTIHDSVAKFDLHSFARAGAIARIKEIQAEIAAITKIFPHLQFGSALSPAMPDSADVGTKSTVRSRKRRRKKAIWSAAQRKAVSERMKRYWAKQRRA
jgi:hypothetical protein